MKLVFCSDIGDYFIHAAGEEELGGNEEENSQLHHVDYAELGQTEQEMGRWKRQKVGDTAECWKGQVLKQAAEMTSGAREAGS